MESRTVVVTGGTRGIGEALSRRFADAGHRVVALARTIPDDVPSGVEVRACDLTDRDSLVANLHEIGDVDILINNAGISSSNTLARTSDAQWDEQLAVNATAPFVATRAVIAGMSARGWGRIVTIASTASLEGSAYVSAYVASKHAVLGLMRAVAEEVAGSGVTANTVCPTYVRTDMTLTTIDNIAARTGSSRAEAERKLAALTPHGRIIQVAEVADAVIALVEGDANGSEILLDGRRA